MAIIELNLNVTIHTKLVEGTCTQKEAITMLIEQIKADIETVYNIDVSGKNCWFENTEAEVELMR